MKIQDKVVFDLSAGAELVEGALGHPWEDVDHRVQPILLVPLSKGDYLEQMFHESTVIIITFKSLFTISFVTFWKNFSII